MGWKSTLLAQPLSLLFLLLLSLLHLFLVFVLFLILRFSSLFSYFLSLLLFPSSWILLQYSICIFTSSSVFIASLRVPWLFRQLCHGMVQWGKQWLFFSFSISSTRQLNYYKLRGAREVWCESKRLIYSKKLLFTLHLLSFVAPTVNNQLWARASWCRSKRRMFLSKLFPTLQHPSLASTIVFANALEQYLYLKSDDKKRVYCIELLQSFYTPTLP